MRSEPLDRARLKLKRAWAQIRELENDVRAYLATEPYLPKIHFDAPSETLTVSFVESRDSRRCVPASSGVATSRTRRLGLRRFNNLEMR